MQENMIKAQKQAYEAQSNMRRIDDEFKVAMQKAK